MYKNSCDSHFLGIIKDLMKNIILSLFGWEDMSVNNPSTLKRYEIISSWHGIYFPLPLRKAFPSGHNLKVILCKKRSYEYWNTEWLSEKISGMCTVPLSAVRTQW